MHKDTIVIAITAAGEVGNATAYGTIANTSAAVQTLGTRLRQAGSVRTGNGSGPMKFCYARPLSDRLGTLPARLSSTRKNPVQKPVREVRVKVDSGELPV